MMCDVNVKVDMDVWMGGIAGGLSQQGGQRRFEGKRRTECVRMREQKGSRKSTNDQKYREQIMVIFQVEETTFLGRRFRFPFQTAREQEGKEKPPKWPRQR